MISVVYTIAGAVLILAALRDLFHTLFHPAAQGAIGDWLARRIWRFVRKELPRHLTLAGPIAFVAVVLYWAASIILGFALIYLPRLPHSFAFTHGLDPSTYASFVGAVDVSICAIITLSTGTYATSRWIQFLMGVEAIFGFALLTASVSWILSIYPVLEHRRSLAHAATLLHFSEATNFRRLEDVTDSDLHTILLSLTGQITTSRNELTQFPITYYFHENEAQTALAGVLPYIADLARRFSGRNGAAGLGAFTLGGAIDDYLKLIAKSHLRCPFSSRDEILRAFAHDQCREMVAGPEATRRAA